MSKTYIVGVREVHVSSMKITAESKEQAIDLIKEGDGEEVNLEYSHTLDSDLFTVEEVIEGELEKFPWER